MPSEKAVSLLDKQIGQKIKAFRKKKNLTTKELGMCIHVSQQQVSRYERGINQINIDLLAELSFLFGVPIFEFLKKE